MIELEQNYDVVIAGAGAAGCYAALHLPPHLRVLLLAKREATLCNSALAQGGIFRNILQKQRCGPGAGALIGGELRNGRFFRLGGNAFLQGVPGAAARAAADPAGRFVPAGGAGVH